MTTRLNAFTQAAGIAFLLVLVPGFAVSQEKNVSAVKQPEQAAGEPARQEQAPAPSPAAISTTPAPAEGPEYIIKQGDTLWDIANTFLQDPFLWPFIWKANPAITNPDLIHTGSRLSIPSLGPIERAMKPAEAAPAEPMVEKQTPAEETAEAEVKPAPAAKMPAEETIAPAPESPPGEGIAAARATLPRPAKPSQPAVAEEELMEGSRLIIPEEQALPMIDKYAMLSAGFVNGVESGDKIVGGQNGFQTIYGYDDIVYVKVRSKDNVNIGDKYLIYAPLGKVTHPKTGERYGRLIRGLGILQIISKDLPDVLTARISLSFDAIEKNNSVVPYQEPSLIYPSSQKKAKDISGYILEVADERTINAQMDFVYLDKGSVDGVEPGDQFVVYAEPERKGFPRKAIGEVQVFLVKDRTSTAVVRKSTIDMAKGNAVDFKK